MVQIAVVGVGLMGGSLGKALRSVRKGGRRVYQVSGWGRSPAHLRMAKRSGALDQIFSNPGPEWARFDIVVLCVPVHKIAPVAQKIIPFLKSGAILTDVGSVKNNIENQMTKLLRKRKNVVFVGAHPLAGSEKAGVGFAKKDLFKKASCVLIPSPQNKSALPKIQKMWSDVGSRCIKLTAPQHDRILALTSHLPHLLSFALFSLALKESKKTAHFKFLCAGAFRDMTRVAGADPTVWAGIFDFNRAELNWLKRIFMSELSLLMRGNESKIHRHLTHLSRSKKRWIN